MAGLRRWHAFLAAGLLGSAGCLSFCHPVATPPAELVESCTAYPQYCRGRIYVFLVNGVDPVALGNLSGLREYLLQIGFTKTYQGELYHAFYFTDEIRWLHRNEPEGRFVLVGQGLGANVIRLMAQDLGKDKIQISRLIYLDGNLMDTAERPENVERVVNILADKGCFWRGDEQKNAENVHLNDGSHFGAATHPNTLQALTSELVSLAGEVPIDGMKGTLPEPETAPAPRTVSSAARADWNFLKPVKTLQARCPFQYPPPDPNLMQQAQEAIAKKSKKEPTQALPVSRTKEAKPSEQPPAAAPPKKPTLPKTEFHSTD